MSKRVSNRRGKGGARSKVRLGWRKRQVRDLIRQGVLVPRNKKNESLLTTIKRMFK